MLWLLLNEYAEDMFCDEIIFFFFFDTPELCISCYFHNKIWEMWQILFFKPIKIELCSKAVIKANWKAD